MAVMPSCRQIRWISSRTRLAVAGSRLATGSSARMVLGAWISARAIPTRCCWPPDSSSAAERPIQQLNPIENLERQAALGSTRREQRAQGGVEPEPAEQHILQRRMAGDQMMLLEYHGRLPAVTAQRCSAREDRLIIAADDGATRRPGKPVQASQQRGFAGPGGTE
jgi:hypothetical protein